MKFISVLTIISYFIFFKGCFESDKQVEKDGKNISSNNSNLNNEGLVAYYPFNGNANDESGNENNGTVERAKLTSDRLGNPNSAYEFRGNTLINCGHGSSLQLTNGASISLWFKPNTSSVFGTYLIDKAASYEYSILWDNWSGGSGLKSDFGGGNADEIGTTFYPSINTWYHVAVTWQYPGDFKIYINGSLLKSQRTTHEMVPTNEDLVIGCRGPVEQGFRSFNGIIDEVRIYNRAISDEEVKALYNIKDNSITHIKFSDLKTIIRLNEKIKICGYLYDNEGHKLKNTNIFVDDPISLICNKIATNNNGFFSYETSIARKYGTYLFAFRTNDFVTYISAVVGIEPKISDRILFDDHKKKEIKKINPNIKDIFWDYNSPTMFLKTNSLEIELPSSNSGDDGKIAYYLAINQKNYFQSGSYTIPNLDIYDAGRRAYEERTKNNLTSQQLIKVAVYVSNGILCVGGAVESGGASCIPLAILLEKDIVKEIVRKSNNRSTCDKVKIVDGIGNALDFALTGASLTIRGSAYYLSAFKVAGTDEWTNIYQTVNDFTSFTDNAINLGSDLNCSVSNNYYDVNLTSKDSHGKDYNFNIKVPKKK